MQPASNNEYQKEYQKLRTKRVMEILKSDNMSNDDFVFLDNFVKTYFPEASKALKSNLTQEALKKVYQGTKYKELDTNEIILTPKDFSDYIILVVSGKVNIVEDDKADDSNAVVKSFSKSEVINLNELQALAEPDKKLRGVCAEKTEIMIYEKSHYEAIIKEFASAITNTKVKAISKNFLKIKKLDRGSKEEFMTYFKQEKFAKGTVIVNLKSKVEEIYIIQTGKVVICAPNEGGNASSHPKLIIGVLGPETLFNESTLVAEKSSPYYAICLEDIELISLNKTNLPSVTDPDTINDLRANWQCKQRLQSTLLEKYQKMSREEVDKSQNKICDRSGVKIKDVLDVFEKFDPKAKNSLQFVKNLEKFNKSVEKPGSSLRSFNAGPLQKFSEFATPRLVSKDPNFKNLDPQRQLALLKLRNEGANRRAGEVIPSRTIGTMNKDDIIKMQSRLLNEEKQECDRIVQKKSIGDRMGLNKVTEEEKDSMEGKKGLFNKMRMDNTQLLAKFGVAKDEKEDKEGKEEKEEKEEKATPAQQETSAAEPPVIKASGDADKIGMRGKLGNLLGVGLGPNIRPQADIVNKKRTSLLKNPNLL